VSLASDGRRFSALRRQREVDDARRSWEGRGQHRRGAVDDVGAVWQEDGVERHGSESYFVLGEGLLGQSLDGRDEALAHAAAADAPTFRFSRMGPKGTGRQLNDAVRKKLADAMAAGGDGTGKIPAGYTYLGQFLDHDLTFDKTTVTLGTSISPAQLLQGRSPSLDLDDENLAVAQTHRDDPLP